MNKIYTVNTEAHKKKMERAGTPTSYREPKDYVFFYRKKLKIYGHPDMIVQCKKCKEWKNQKYFGVHWHDTYGIRDLKSECRDCMLHTQKVRRDLRKEINVGEGVECAICKSKELKLQIDHCHRTDKFRGLLCTRCNSSIGWLLDEALGLINPLLYLIKAEHDINKLAELKGKLKRLICEVEQKIRVSNIN